MIPGLLITHGRNKGTYIRFPENDPFWIGRRPDCNFILDGDPRVSGQHCCFVRKGGELKMTDKSTNGTKWNGNLVQNLSIYLFNADILSMGETHFQVVDVDEALSERTSSIDKSVDFDFKASMDAIEKRKTSNQKTSIFEGTGPYLNIDVIGEGGMGKVYKAVHREEKKLVALKVLKNVEALGMDFEGRFLREIHLLQKIDHPYIIRLYDAGTFKEQNESYHFIALEYFQGIELNTHVRVNGKIPWKKAVKILIQVAEALGYLHSNGILHRDIKPANILYNDIKGIAKIIDLGLGKCINEEERQTLCITAPNTAMGTPNYMSVEQWMNTKEVHKTADIYSLGATSYYFLSGQVPFAGHRDPLSIYRAIKQNQLKPLEELVDEDVPYNLINVIQKMMAFDATARYQDCKEFLPELKAL